MGAKIVTHRPWIGAGLGWLLVVAASISLVGAGCSNNPSGIRQDAAPDDAALGDGGLPDDAAPDDGGVSDDAEATDDAGGPDGGPVTAPSLLSHTEGGGAASSPSYRAQIQLGAPQPMGDTTSSNYSLRLGPNAN